MKTNRVVAMAAIALLVVGAMGAVSIKAFARSGNPPVQSQACDQQDNDAAEVQNAPDTDNVDLQCGDQNAPDNGQEAEGVESADGQDAAPTEVQNAPDTDNVDLQRGDQNAPDSGQEAEGVESADGQDAAPTGTPAITAEAAQKAAESYLNAGTAVKVQLDDENGVLVYSVEFSNGTDVKVDSVTGSVIGADATQD